MNLFSTLPPNWGIVALAVVLAMAFALLLVRVLGNRR